MDVQHQDHRCRLGTLVDQFTADADLHDLPYLEPSVTRSESMMAERNAVQRRGAPMTIAWFISISMPTYADGRNRLAKVRNEPVVASRIRIVASNAEVRRALRERRLPPRARRLRPRGRVVQQSDIGGANLAVQFGREAVRRDVDHASAAARSPSGSDSPLPLDRADSARPRYPLPLFARGVADGLRMQARMAEGAIQVDDETRDRGGHERRPESCRQLPGHAQRADIVSEVRPQIPLAVRGTVGDSAPARGCRRARR